MYSPKPIRDHDYRILHPQSNSLPGKILEKLAEEIHFAGNHSESKVIILKVAVKKRFAPAPHSMNWCRSKQRKKAWLFQRIRPCDQCHA